MATVIDITVEHSTRFFKVGRMYGIFGSFRVARRKTLFLIFKLNGTKYSFSIWA